MTLKFEDWLSNQQSRSDLVGDFARIISFKTIESKPSKLKRDEHKIWADVVVGLELSFGYMDAFNTAWQEFQVAKADAKLPDE